MGTVTLRKLELRSGTHLKTRERVSAIAWATNRRGRVPWKSGNVTTTIREYLTSRGYPIEPVKAAGSGGATSSAVSSALRAIERDGFGYIKMNDNGTRIVEFGFHDDVNLNGHGLPKESTLATLAASTTEVTDVSQNGNTDPTERLKSKASPSLAFTPPPIPGAPEVLPYRMDELNALLKAWHEAVPEAYSQWVDAAIDSLGVST